MIAPTHIAFAVAIGQLAGLNSLNLNLLAAGALLPDIDHPQSTVGRLLSFLSVPINKKFGHRKVIHGFFLWTGLALCGHIWEPALFLGLGALSHCFIDCWNVSGVQALEPFSEQVCVIFRRSSWRISTGSRKELFVLLFLGMAVGGAIYIGSFGGIRAAVGEMLGSYNIAYERYLREGTNVCYLEGKLRTADGNIFEDKWLIIGREGSRGLAILADDKILHIPKDAHFLRARLRVDENNKKWETAEIKGLAETLKPVYVLKKGEWRKAKAGSFVSGVIIGERIELDFEGDIWELVE
jgi:membrane-bound metal-dependent hydrolase YbcI (DUF457 family)